MEKPDLNVSLVKKINAYQVINLHIPFNKPAFIHNEEYFINLSMNSGHASGDGDFTKKCHKLLERSLQVKKVLLTTSCTHALEMAAILLDLKEGDEVIVPSFTFVSTANAFVLRGARPVFIDIRPDTLNMDERLLENLITPRTKAIVPVHYAGVGCEMDEIMRIAGSHGISVVEDDAHGLFGTYRGRYLGTFGALATQSFHETKNFTCGEGGALLINDESLVDRAEIIREKGTNRSRFFRGKVDKYTWVDIGSSYLPSDILAAILYAQLEQREKIQTLRRAIWDRYERELCGWAELNGVRMPFIPEYCGQAYHIFYLLLPDTRRRTSFLETLKSRDILSVFHYLPLHLSPMGERFGGKPGDCPIAEDISGRLVRLPFYNSMTDDEQGRVIEAVLKLSFL